VIAVQVLPFDDNLCIREPCLNFEECYSVLRFGNTSAAVGSDMMLFRLIIPANTFSCKCPRGFTGSYSISVPVYNLFKSLDEPINLKFGFNS